jgi:3-phenylpropionate/trans-cinnamate dioxygenase ferredoxin reductase subunit
VSDAVRTVAIAGASLAGVTAATTLRQEGFDGRIVLIGDETLPPYERPGLSKGYLRGEEGRDDLLARPADWYEANAVDLRPGTRVARLDPAARALVLGDGSSVPFDAALIATGAADRRLGVPGADLPGVLGLRTVADADAIRAAAAGGGPAVIVGMGFIGAEVAASLRQLGVEVTVVEVFQTALERVLGTDAGRVIEGLHRDHGVRMVFGDTVEAFEGVDRVERVRTKRGDRIECSFAVVGIGVTPNADLWPLDRAPDGGIPVGPTLQTEVPGVFAAGDVASHAHPSFGPLRVEHYDNAIKMGEAAARAMLGADAPFDDPHWFWSDQYDVRVEMVGVAPEDPTVVLRGSYETGAFCAFSLDRNGVLRAATSVAWPKDVRRASKLVQARVRPDPDELADPDVDLRTLIQA